LPQITIAIDAMGGDHGIPVVIPAALQILQEHPDLHLILVGDQPSLEKKLAQEQASNHPRVRIKHASQKVEMDESPTQALRSKKDSSMRVAINLIKEGEAQACVSAGNTGALMATAKFVLKTLPGIDRPAIMAVLPTMSPKANVRVLDLGANVDSSAENLLQFAIMGSVLSSAVDGISRPRVGLLNIGAEDIKGNEQVRETAQLLAENTSINYIGFIEGDDIYKGAADVVVCDGFVGNVMLKACEGLARLIMSYIKEGFKHSWLTRLSGLAAMHVLKRVGKRVDPARYNGASLLGLQGIVIKSHGGANTMAYKNAIREAYLEVKKDIPKRVGDQITQLLQN
jgi:glycerol-3-phosphate acyltransferase PlsX